MMSMGRGAYGTSSQGTAGASRHIKGANEEFELAERRLHWS